MAKRTKQPTPTTPSSNLTTPNRPPTTSVDLHFTKSPKGNEGVTGHDNNLPTSKPPTNKFPSLLATLLIVLLSSGAGLLGGYTLFSTLHYDACRVQLQASYEAARTRVQQEMTREVDECKFQHQALQAQIASWQQKAAAAQSDLRTQREEYEAASDARTRQVQALRDELDAQLAHHGAGRDELASCQTERNANKEQVTNLTQRLDAQTAAHEDVQAQLDALQAKEQQRNHMDDEKHERQLDNLRKRLHDHRADAQQAQQQCDEEMVRLTQALVEQQQQQSTINNNDEDNSRNIASISHRKSDAHTELLSLQRTLQQRFLEQTKLKYGSDALQVELTLDLGSRGGDNGSNANSGNTLQTIVIHIERLDVLPMTIATFLYLLEAGLYTGTHLYAEEALTDKRLLQGGQLPRRDEAAARRILLNHTTRWAAHGFQREKPLLWANEATTRQAPCPRYGLGMDWYQQGGGDFFVVLDIASAPQLSSSPPPCFGRVVRGMHLLHSGTRGTMAHAKIRAISFESTTTTTTTATNGDASSAGEEL